MVWPMRTCASCSEAWLRLRGTLRGCASWWLGARGADRGGLSGSGLKLYCRDASGERGSWEWPRGGEGDRPERCDLEGAPLRTHTHTNTHTT